MPSYRELNLDETLALSNYFSMDRRTLESKLHLGLVQISRIELLALIAREIRSAFVSSKDRTIPTLDSEFGIKSRWVTEYLIVLQDILCSKADLCQRINQIPNITNEPEQLAILISDLIDQNAPWALVRRASPILVGVFIVKIGVEQFCNCSDALL